MERQHHLATDHGPMVQGGLLTAHPDGDHGGGETSGGQSSLHQGAGTILPAVSRSESLLRRNTGRNRVTGLLTRVFSARRIYRRKDTLRGGPRGPGGQRVRPPPGRAREALGQGLAPSGPPSDFWILLLWKLFWYFFWNFLSTFIFHLFLQCTNKNRQKLALGTELIG